MRNISKIRLFSLVLAVTAVVGAWIAFNPMSLLDSAEANLAEARSTSEVRVASLTASFDAEGTIAPEMQWDLVLPAGGTITSIAVVGSTVTTGFEVVAIDAKPVLALTGPIPAWRTMAVEDEGADVLALEEALVHLGYDTSGELTVDGYYSSYTASLVELWQADQGRSITGSVALGDVVIVPLGTKISMVAVQLGGAPTGALMTFSAPARTVLFEANRDQRAALEVGDEVEVRFEDRSTETTVIKSIGSTGTGAWLVTTGALTSATALELETADVNVLWSTDLGTDLTVVNGNALVRLDGGRYALEVIRTSERDTEFVSVELGVRSGSTVEISGVEPGTLIVVP